MQPPPTSPPQWSADGQWWWDGTRWRARAEVMAPPAPTYWTPPPGYAMPANFQMPPPIDMRPSPGLRIVLIVALAIDALLSGFFALFGVLGTAQGGASDFGVDLLVIFFLLWFALTLFGLIGVSIRARWSRWAAIGAGIVVSLTCLGLVLGIPILITAARAPDLRRAT